MDTAQVVTIGLSLFGSGALTTILTKLYEARHETAIVKIKGDLDARHASKLETLKSDLEREVRGVQTQLDRTLLVHRVQFETEFKALQIIWAKVITVRGFMAALRPTFSTHPPDETPEQEFEKFKARFQKFAVALGEAKDAIFENEPFITPALSRELYQYFLTASSAEMLSVQLHSKETTIDWYERGAKNLEDLQASVTRVSGMIRARTQELAVIPKGEQ